MKFSIIMPVYNAERYMKKAVVSVLMQDFSDFELILADDGSQDRSYKIARAFCEIDPRVVVLHQENRGPSAARNIGIRKAVGEYLMFIDADDLLEPGALQTIDERLREDPVDMVCFGYKTVRKNRNKEVAIDLKPEYRLYGTREEISKEQISIINSYFFYVVWNKVFKASLIKGNGILMKEDLHIGEDYCFNLEALMKAGNYCELNRSLYNYIVQNEKSISSRYSPDKWEQMQNVHSLRSSHLRHNTYLIPGQVEAEIRFDFARMCLAYGMELHKEENGLALRQKYQVIGKLLRGTKYRFTLSDLRYLSWAQRIPYLVVFTKNRYVVGFFSYLIYIYKFKSNLYREKA